MTSQGLKKKVESAREAKSKNKNKQEAIAEICVITELGGNRIVRIDV